MLNPPSAEETAKILDSKKRLEIITDWEPIDGGFRIQIYPTEVGGKTVDMTNNETIAFLVGIESVVLRLGYLYRKYPNLARVTSATLASDFN